MIQVMIIGKRICFCVDRWHKLVKKEEYAMDKLLENINSRLTEIRKGLLSTHAQEKIPDGDDAVSYIAEEFCNMAMSALEVELNAYMGNQQQPTDSAAVRRNSVDFKMVKNPWKANKKYLVAGV